MKEEPTYEEFNDGTEKEIKVPLALSTRILIKESVHIENSLNYVIAGKKLKEYSYIELSNMLKNRRKTYKNYPIAMTHRLKPMIYALDKVLKYYDRQTPHLTRSNHGYNEVFYLPWYKKIGLIFGLYSFSRDNK